MPEYDKSHFNWYGIYTSLQHKMNAMKNWITFLVKTVTMLKKRDCTVNIYEQETGLFI